MCRLQNHNASLEAYLLAWQHDWWGTYLMHVGVACAIFVAVCLSIGTAVERHFRTTEVGTRARVSSWTGDAKVLTKGSLSGDQPRISQLAIREATSDQLGDARLVTKGDLTSAFREATSVHLGDSRLVLESDINSIDKWLDSVNSSLSGDSVLHDMLDNGGRLVHIQKAGVQRLMKLWLY